jgi:hypothetical protein
MSLHSLAHLEGIYSQLNSLAVDTYKVMMALHLEQIVVTVLSMLMPMMMMLHDPMDYTVVVDMYLKLMLAVVRLMIYHLETMV